jgi:hypothetical protein
MSGVVSLPHGFGHDQPGVQMRTATRRPGVNLNRLISNGALDPLSGNAVLNAVPISLKPYKDGQNGTQGEKDV